MTSSIPDGITRDMLLEAILKLNSGANHSFGNSILYDLIYDGERYPPKAVVGLAGETILGRPMIPYDFKGGLESKCFRILINAGFNIVPKPTRYTIITENDESDWLDVTGVRYHYPKRYIKHLMPGTQVIYYKGKLKNIAYRDLRLTDDPHYFGMGTVGDHYQDAGSNKGDYFSEVIDYRNFRGPVIAKENETFIEVIPDNKKSNYWRDGVRPIDKTVYDRILKLAGIQQSDNVELPNISDDLESYAKEGRKRVRYSSYYERRPEYRRLALEFHGLTCRGCNFNFELMYGERGRGFIHVHHVVPVSEYGEAKIINPYTDLVPVCPNCHAMIHRRKDHTLSIEEIKALVTNPWPVS